VLNAIFLALLSALLVFGSGYGVMRLSLSFIALLGVQVLQLLIGVPVQTFLAIQFIRWLKSPWIYFVALASSAILHLFPLVFYIRTMYQVFPWTEERVLPTIAPIMALCAGAGVGLASAFFANKFSTSNKK
jgi:hypothetical protein